MVTTYHPPRTCTLGVEAIGFRVVPGILEQISSRLGRCSASSWSYSLTWILALPHVSSNGLWSPTRGRSLPQYHRISRTIPKKAHPWGGGPESTVSGTRESQSHATHRYRPLTPQKSKVPSPWGKSSSATQLCLIRKGPCTNHVPYAILPAFPVGKGGQAGPLGLAQVQVITPIPTRHHILPQGVRKAKQ